MFERPDADYLQDLLAGYVLGTLDRVERHYLEEQMARDPKLQQVLYQLEQALDTVEHPHHHRQAALPKAAPTVRRPVQTRPPERRWAKWIIVLSALSAVGVVSVALPWLRQRYEIRQFVSSWIPGHAEVDSSLTAWQGLQLLLEDHTRVQQATQAESTPAILDPTEQEEIYATLEQVFGETGGLQTLTGDNIYLLRGNHYEQPHLHGLRLTYRLGEQNPATSGTVITVYQLQPQGEQDLWLPGRVFIEASNGTNVLVWRSQSTIYAIAAQLPLETLRSQVDSLSPF